jgi:hypothetical protein
MKPNAPAPAAAFFATLPGDWSVTRSVSGSPNAADFSGQAQFTPDPHDPNLLYYREIGVSRVDGQDIESTQEYQYILRPDNVIQVRHGDGNDFLMLPFQSPRVARGTHQCGQDLYQARLDLRSTKTFRLTFMVGGLRKAYSHITDFRKD